LNPLPDHWLPSFNFNVEERDAEIAEILGW